MNGKLYCDYLEAKTKSLDGNIGEWLYKTGSFTSFNPVAISKKKSGDTLRRLADDGGIPDRLRTDLALELTGKNIDFQAQASQLNLNVTHSEAERSNQNHAAECEIGELNKRY